LEGKATNFYLFLKNDSEFISLGLLLIVLNNYKILWTLLLY